MTNTRNAHEAAVDTKIAAATLAHERAYSVESALALFAASAEYEGWSRFFIVPNGHIHSSMSCSTCNRVTSKWGSYSVTLTNFEWLPELSGLTNEDAVAEYGAILCTRCFADAPVEQTSGVNIKDAAAKAAAKNAREIARIPAVKKLTAKLDLIARKNRTIENYERTIARFDQDERDIAAGVISEHVGWVVTDSTKARVEIPKLQKQIARAEAQLIELQAAADAAIADAGF